MTIDHIALWVKDLELMKSFYSKYFDGEAGEKYVNKAKQFSSYFIRFESGCRLEIMHRPQISEIPQATPEQEGLGITHFAFSVGSKEKVDELTKMLRNDGYVVAGQPRQTGDGYYESVVLDPEHNRIEITV